MILFVPLQSHVEPSTLPRRSVAVDPAPVAATTAPDSASADRYRSRDFGVGYGSSSGYASGRHYVDRSARALFRCR